MDVRHHSETCVRKHTGEDHSPPKKKLKRTINVGSLFDRKVEDEDEASKKQSRPPHTKTKEQDPIYLRYAAATGQYRKRATSAKTQSLSDVQAELTARVHGLTVSGQSLDVEGVPTQDDIDALIAEDRRISKPMGEEVLTLENTLHDGSIKHSNVKLADTFANFEDHLTKANNSVTLYLRELEEIAENIKAANEQLLYDEEKGQVKKLTLHLEKDLNAFEKEVLEVENWKASETEKAKEEEKATSAEMDRKLEEFMMGMQ